MELELGGSDCASTGSVDRCSVVHSINYARRKAAKDRSNLRNRNRVLVVEAADPTGPPPVREDIVALVENARGVEVDSIVPSRDGKRVILTMPSYADVALAAAALKQSDGGQLNTRRPKDSGTLFILRGIRTTKAEKELEQHLRTYHARNFAGAELLEVKKIMSNGWNGTQSVILLAKGEMASAMRNMSRFQVDYQPAWMQVFVEIDQCFECGAYGHKSNSRGKMLCTRAKRCVRSPGDHSKDNCPAVADESMHRCLHCIDAGAPDVKTMHRSNSGACPIRAKYISDYRHASKQF